MHWTPTGVKEYDPRSSRQVIKYAIDQFDGGGEEEVEAID